MELVKVTVEDLDEIAKIYTANWLKTYKGLLPNNLYSLLSIEKSKIKWVNYLNDSKNNMLTAKENNKILGYTAFKPCQLVENSLLLDSLHIAEFAQGKGVGKSLFNHVCKFAHEHNYKKISICVVNGNLNAENIYMRWGAKFQYDFFDELYSIKFASRLLVLDSF